MGYDMTQAAQSVPSRAYANSPETPTPESAASQELGRLASAIGEMEMQFEALRSRLQPVTIPVSTKDPSGSIGGVPAKESLGVLVDTISCSAYRVDSLARSMNTLRSALAV